MRWSWYCVTTKHDDGIRNLTVYTTSAERAAEIIMTAEKCPRRAIIKIKRLGRKHK